MQWDAQPSEVHVPPASSSMVLNPITGVELVVDTNKEYDEIAKKTKEVHILLLR